MTLPTYVLGVDPGPIPGIVGLRITDERISAVEVIQCSANIAPSLVGWQLGAAPGFLTERRVLAVERFVVGPRAARSSTPAAGRVTRELIGVLTDCAASLGITCVTRSASEVMPWATDKRLDAAGLLDPTKGMQHARAAARHALFAAAADCGLPDPLSSRHRSPEVSS